MFTPEQIADKKTEIVKRLPEFVKALGFPSNYHKAELILKDMEALLLELKADELDRECDWLQTLEVRSAWLPEAVR